jgi:myo-inositol 2-dehydrogenase/D-chiro-inositol 1-dehydrogenase
MAIFRLGVVGAGRMGRTHLSALRASERLRVVAVTEPAAAARRGVDSPGVAVHAELDGMLRGGGLDGVLVAAPSTLHLETVRRIAAAGLPILCEKPCGVSAAEAKAAADIAATAGVPLQIAYWRRFVPALKRLQQRIAAGELGELYLVTCYQWDEKPPAATFRRQSGGILIDMGVHEFDQVRWLSGQEFATIGAAPSAAASEPPVDGDPESAQLLATLSGGGTAFISLGRRFPLGDVCRAEVFGTEGAEDCRFLWPPSAESVFKEALRLQAEGFAAWVGGSPAQGATAADAIAALEAAERAGAILGDSATRVVARR